VNKIVKNLIYLMRKLVLKFYQIPRLERYPFLKRINLNNYFLDRFINSIENTDTSKVMLDAGSGSQQYRKRLESIYKYESCDFDNIFDKKYIKNQTYVCSVENLTMADSTYDVVLSMMVLEHLKYPQKAMDEMHRVLKTGGFLYLSTNFMYPRHGKPYDYFRFTKEGLEALAMNSNFSILQISPMGGFPALLATFLFEIPQYLRNKIILGSSYPDADLKFKSKRAVFVICSIIPFILLNIYFQILSLIVGQFDIFDKTYRYTQGYTCIFKKN
jgi:SAM-dependent methyltransferase